MTLADHYTDNAKKRDLHKTSATTILNEVFTRLPAASGATSDQLRFWSIDGRSRPTGPGGGTWQSAAVFTPGGGARLGVEFAFESGQPAPQLVIPVVVAPDASGTLNVTVEGGSDAVPMPDVGTRDFDKVVTEIIAAATRRIDATFAQ